MRILSVNSVCTGSTGRIARSVSRLAMARGDEALMLFGRGAPAPDVPSERIATQAEVYLGVLHARLTDRQGFFGAHATKRAIERIQAFCPDVVHLHNLHGYYLDMRPLLTYLASSGIPVVWTLHDCHLFTGHCAYFDAAQCDRWRSGCGNCPQTRAYPKSFLLDRSQRNLSDKRALLARMPRLTFAVPSDWLNALAQRSFLGAHPIVTLPNGVDRNVFRPTESDLRARFGLENKRLILGATNIWEPRKGFDACLALASQLDADTTLVLVGLRPEQIGALPDHVIGLPRTANAKELAAWYSAADVFINPTREENFPTSQLEALACGTPVVAFDTGGCRESLNESCGFVVPKDDIAALRTAIDRAALLSREDCLRRAAQYDETVRFGAYLSLFDSVVKEGLA